jgi:hypothetical protein
MKKRQRSKKGRRFKFYRSYPLRFQALNIYHRRPKRNWLWNLLQKPALWWLRLWLRPVQNLGTRACTSGFDSGGVVPSTPGYGTGGTGVATALENGLSDVSEEIDHVLNLAIFLAPGVEAVETWKPKRRRRRPPTSRPTSPPFWSETKAPRRRRPWPKPKKATCKRNRMKSQLVWLAWRRWKPKFSIS